MTTPTPKERGAQNGSAPTAAAATPAQATQSGKDRVGAATAGPRGERTKYQHTYRRMLLDMHIPDWDEEFLAQYDPEALAEAYALAGVSGVLFYCKSHIGLNYWPAPVGAVHPVARNRDLVGEMHQALVRRGIAPAAYHTVVFDNWAVENHPEWASVPVSQRKGITRTHMGARYGTASVANRDYREYEKTQVRALLERYDFDALFIDMVFWNVVSIDEASVQRYRQETGQDIPTQLDWTDPAFVRFQAARERWLLEFLEELIATAKSVRPGIAVTHNIGPGTNGWYTAQKLAWSDLDDFAAGDIYGGRDEQLIISKLMQHLGKAQPAEFMTTRTTHLWNHVAIKTEHMMAMEALGTIAHQGAFLFIDAIDPRGSVNTDVYRRVGRVFSRVAQHEGELGGTPVEDVAVYYCDEARITPWESGTDLADVGTLDPSGQNTGKAAMPHINAVVQASAKLQRAHIPFGVITSSQLGDLSRYRVVVLPDLVRMSTAEVDAFRAYVAGGGGLYVSGRTSLLDADGTVHEDFALADVLGVHLAGREEGAGIFLRARSPLLHAAVYPEHYLGHGWQTGMVGAGYPDPRLALPRISAEEDCTQVHATLNLPYAYPSPGSLHAHDFASIHSSPPWQDRGEPTIVEHHYGQGRTFYSVAPIENSHGDGDERAFISIVTELLGGAPTLQADAHPVVWVTAYRQPERHRILVSALAYDTQAPFPPTPVHLTYTPQPSEQVHGVVSLSGEPVRHRVHRDGRVSFDSVLQDSFGMYAVLTEPITG